MTWKHTMTAPVICRKCGHTPDRHTSTECKHVLGLGLGFCDCDGWDRDPYDELPKESLA